MVCTVKTKMVNSMQPLGGKKMSGSTMKQICPTVQLPCRTSQLLTVISNWLVQAFWKVALCTWTHLTMPHSTVTRVVGSAKTTICVSIASSSIFLRMESIVCSPTVTRILSGACMEVIILKLCQQNAWSIEMGMAVLVKN